MQQTVDMLSAKSVNKSASLKLLYIDNLVIGLTILVVMHHAFITYGAPGRCEVTDMVQALFGYEQ